jgi:hypothetical protein
MSTPYTDFKLYEKHAARGTCTKYTEGNFIYFVYPNNYVRFTSIKERITARDDFKSKFMSIESTSAESTSSTPIAIKSPEVPEVNDDEIFAYFDDHVNTNVNVNDDSDIDTDTECYSECDDDDLYEDPLECPEFGDSIDVLPIRIDGKMYNLLRIPVGTDLYLKAKDIISKESAFHETTLRETTLHETTLRETTLHELVLA